MKRSYQRRVHGVLKATYRSTVKQCRDCPLKAACTRERYRRLEVAETIVYEQFRRSKPRVVQRPDFEHALPGFRQFCLDWH